MIESYLRDLYETVKTILLGMKVTVRYCFARSVTVQYPDVAPVLQPRFRGFHVVDLTKCIACELCNKACPVECIYVEKGGTRKVDKATGLAVGGPILRYAIDYSKCLFCGLCVSACGTKCIEMGDNHDLSGYDRQSMIVEFTELAKEGMISPMPLWVQRDRLPAWAAERKEAWLKRYTADKEALARVLVDTTPPKKKPAEARPAASS